MADALHRHHNPRARFGRAGQRHTRARFRARDHVIAAGLAVVDRNAGLRIDMHTMACGGRVARRIRRPHRHYGIIGACPHFAGGIACRPGAIGRSRHRPRHAFKRHHNRRTGFRRAVQRQARRRFRARDDIIAARLPHRDRHRDFGIDLQQMRGRAGVASSINRRNLHRRCVGALTHFSRAEVCRPGPVRPRRHGPGHAFKRHRNPRARFRRAGQCQ
ncbi:MAG: hypothetical protein ACD_54C01299G0001, partial [uncultured bacterium]